MKRREDSAVHIKKWHYSSLSLLKIGHDVDYEKRRREYSRTSKIFEMFLNVPELLNTLGRGVVKLSHWTCDIQSEFKGQCRFLRLPRGTCSVNLGLVWCTTQQTMCLIFEVHASPSRKILRTSTWETATSSPPQHIKMGSLFEQPRNAGTLCKICAKLKWVHKANMTQSSAAKKSAVQTLEIRMVWPSKSF